MLWYCGIGLAVLLVIAISYGRCVETHPKAQARHKKFEEKGLDIGEKLAGKGHDRDKWVP